MLSQWQNSLNKFSQVNPEKILFPYFQPIFCIASGLIVGYEALARQYDEQGQVISAGKLFSSPSIPEEQLIAWDRMVRHQALTQFSQLNYKGYLAINISASWIDHVTDLKALPTLQMLDKLNIDRSRIIIEITESHCDLDKIAAVVREYRKHDLKVAIDDFGAGFSQLERIMAIRPDILKLDMRLFKQAAKGGIANEVVHLLNRLSMRTACRIVCEGVETDNEFFYALSCGTQYVQGHLFSPAEAVFKAPDHHRRHIESLRQKFLKKTLLRERQKMQSTRKIKELVEILRQALVSDFNLDELSAHPFEESGVLRFYLCNNEGNQISSNFNFAGGKWFEEPREIGFNWSWRPYFYHLLALEHASTNNRLVASEHYRDFHTDQLCRTLSLRLDENRILSIDIVAEPS